MRPDALERLAHAAQLGQTGQPYAPNVGRMQPMLTNPAPGGLVTLANTPVISMREPAPRQWVVTILQSAQQGQGSPWAQDFDGATYNPPPGPPQPSVFGAPAVPAQASGVTVTLQGILRWAAGGVSGQMRFDWPMAGGVFGVVADTFDLDVFVSSPAAQQGIPQSYVPLVGAFMVPGQSAAEALPLRWQDVTVPALLHGGVAKDWSVKPYARKVQLQAPSTGKLAVSWVTLNGAGIVYVLYSENVFEEQAGEGVNSVIDVPPGALIMRVFNVGVADSSCTPIWRMGLV